MRGLSVAQRGNRYGTAPDYFRDINKHITVVVQIDSRAGMAAARDIAAVEGVDALFVGPSDLAAALGHLGNAAHPRCSRPLPACSTARAAGKPVGILAPLEFDARRYLALAARSVAVGSDLGQFRQATQVLVDNFYAG